MLNGKYLQLYKKLNPTIPANRLLHDDLAVLAFGTDASFYRLLPQLVVKAQTEDEVILVLQECSSLELPMTFRAAGTSLSGQSVSDSVLILLDQGWKKMDILNNGSQIRLQPGVVGSVANKVLLPYAKKIGPDPASINSAMVGGIAANNASGMCCGTAQNSYRTLAGMRFVLYDGTAVDTLDKQSCDRFRKSHAELLSYLSALVGRVKANPALSQRIREKFKMKNTMGYSLNALVDFDDPIDVLQHLLIGSEGTLGFISDITYHTVPEYADKASALMIFSDIETACKAVAVLKTSPVDAVELMDRAALRSVENKEGMPPFLKTLSEDAAALLVETRAASANLLQQNIAAIEKALSQITTVLPLSFTQVVKEYTQLWNIRKGLFPSVGAMRETGTTVIIEDVAFPVPRLAEATLELQSLFSKHGYNDAIIFGHALEGNLHFVFKQDFNRPTEVVRYRLFMDDVTAMVVKKYDGALKAEHGTGRNMAPFVPLEWGAEAYSLMKEIKQLLDPKNLLNPGVIINDDPQVHVKNLKPLPEAHPLVDKCIECGFCEVHCVSNHLTLSARQRIVAYREIRRLQQSGEEPHRLAQLRDGFRYHGNATCATDGLCATGCPVSIDTGQLIKSLRHDTASPFANKVAAMLANNMTTVTSMARFGLNSVDFFHTLFGFKFMSFMAKSVRTLSGNRIPLWTRFMPMGGKKISTVTAPPSARQVVYFPSCITRSMGNTRNDGEAQALTEKTASLIRKAGYVIVYPDHFDELCCGMAFASKGFKEAGDAKAKELEKALIKASRDGELPILCDMSPCLYRMKETLDKSLKLYEPIEFTLTFLAPYLQFKKTSETVAVHPVCSAKKMGLEEQLVQLANMCVEKVEVPDGNCCGFAGDRGFTFPELNAHGLRRLREQLPRECHEGFSTSRTCEIGLSYHSGIHYKSILYLVDRCTVAK
jgi:D-lactate dehydrogenase